MAKIKAPKSWAEQIADLESPMPKDVDPEEYEGAFPTWEGSDSSSSSEDVFDAREHYEEVGKSKLRKQDNLDLGPRYSGARIDRDDLLAKESADDPFGSDVSHSGDPEDDESDQNVVDPDDIDWEGDEGGEDEDIDNEEAFGEGDEDKFKAFTFRGSSGPIDRASGHMGEKSGVGRVRSTVKDQDMDKVVGSDTDESAMRLEDIDNTSEEPEFDNEAIFTTNGTNGHQPSRNSSGDSESEADSDKNSITSDRPSPSSSRAALREMMASEQKAVAATISAATKSDAQKGKAIIQQRQTFSSLLNIRIHLQKALVAANALPTVSTSPNSSLQPTTSSPPDALQAALTLWSHLNALRSTLSSSSNPEKRDVAPTTSTPPSTLWTAMTTHETTSLPSRRAILSKWSARTTPASAIPSRNRFSTKPATSILGVLDPQLQGPGMEKLIRESKGAPAPAPARDEDIEDNADMDTDLPKRKKRKQNLTYDDTPLYTLLLRDLIDQKSSLSSSNPLQPPTIPSIPKPPKQHRKVDTKASKGRKLSYAVHEKLQNFMVGEEGRREWEERRVEEFFGGLLGEGTRLGEGRLGNEDGSGDEGEGEALRLFG